MAVENIRAYRVLRRLSQEELAATARELGAPSFSRQALSEVERGRRSISVDELTAVAAGLELTVGDLLDPYGPGRPGSKVELGQHVVSIEQAHLWIRDKVIPRVRPSARSSNPVPFLNRLEFEPHSVETPAMAQGALRAIRERFERASQQSDDVVGDNGEEQA